MARVKDLSGNGFGEEIPTGTPKEMPEYMYRENTAVNHIVEGSTSQNDRVEGWRRGFPTGYCRIYDTGQYAGVTNVVHGATNEDLENSVAVDVNTGLMFMRAVPEALGGAGNGKFFGIYAATTPGESVFDYADAVNAAELAGHNDWRVPNVAEMMSFLFTAHSDEYPQSTVINTPKPATGILLYSGVVNDYYTSTINPMSYNFRYYCSINSAVSLVASGFGNSTRFHTILVRSGYDWNRRS